MTGEPLDLGSSAEALPPGSPTSDEALGVSRQPLQGWGQPHTPYFCIGLSPGVQRPGEGTTMVSQVPAGCPRPFIHS